MAMFRRAMRDIIKCDPHPETKIRANLYHKIASIIKDKRTQRGEELLIECFQQLLDGHHGNMPKDLQDQIDDSDYYEYLKDIRLAELDKPWIGIDHSNDWMHQYGDDCAKCRRGQRFGTGKCSDCLTSSRRTRFTSEKPLSLQILELTYNAGSEMTDLRWVENCLIELLHKVRSNDECSKVCEVLLFLGSHQFTWTQELITELRKLKFPSAWDALQSIEK